MRHQVEQANQARLRALRGEQTVFKAEDWAGDKTPEQMKTDTYLNNFMAPETLVLKLGAQVMLIKNLDVTLVNGTVGTVVGFGVPELEDSDGEEDIKLSDGTLVKGEKREKTTMEIRNQQRIANAVATGKMELSPVIEWQTPQGIEKKIMAREEFKVEDNQGRKIASRKQVSLHLFSLPLSSFLTHPTLFEQYPVILYVPSSYVPSSLTKLTRSASLSFSQSLGYEVS